MFYLVGYHGYPGVCRGRVKAEECPEDEPDAAAGSPDVEDRFPAQGVGQHAADRQANHGPHLST